MISWYILPITLGDSRFWLGPVLKCIIKNWEKVTHFPLQIQQCTTSKNAPHTICDNWAIHDATCPALPDVDTKLFAHENLLPW